MASQTERNTSPVINHLLSSLPSKATITPADYAQTVNDLLATTLHLRTETLPLSQSLGRQLASDLHAVHHSPSFTNSQMDGYALTAHASARTDRTFTVGQDIAAGSAPNPPEISDNIAYPVMTGAPLPDGYEAVVPVEQSSVLTGPVDEAGFAARGERVELIPAIPGQFVRHIGEDVKVGDLLVPAGSTLTPAHVGVVATQGIDTVEVYAPLQVLVVTGGDELSATGEELHHGRIFDANGPMLQALAQEDGCSVQRASSTDSLEKFTDLLAEELAREKPDLVVTSGGISHGKYEVVRRGLESLRDNPVGGVELTGCWFGHVSQQPGGPQGLALLKATGSNVPVLCLPGNPVSTLISYHLLIRPALGKIRGKEPEHTVGKLSLREPVQSPAHKTQYRRACVSYSLVENGALQALLEPDVATGSHLLHRATRANALVELEPGMTYSGGEIVRYYKL